MKLSVLIPNAEEENVPELIHHIEERLPASQIIVATDRHRRGKGWAMREALSQATGDVIAFIDADMDIAPRMLLRLLPFLEDYDVVVGGKHMTHAPLHRKIITRLSRVYISIVFGLWVDTQTGMKLYRREALTDWDTDDWAFDIEILAKAQKRGLRIVEIPIEAVINAPMSWRAVWRTFGSSIKILLRLLFRVEW